MSLIERKRQEISFLDADSFPRASLFLKKFASRNSLKFKFISRLLPTFAGVFQEKICTHASFTKILANYISEESLLNVDYDKNII